MRIKKTENESVLDYIAARQGKCPLKAHSCEKETEKNENLKNKGDECRLSEKAQQDVKSAPKVLPIRVGPAGNQINLEGLGYRWAPILGTPPDDSPLHNNDMKEALVKMQEHAAHSKAGATVYLPAVKKGLRRRLEQISFAEAAEEMGKINHSMLKKTVYFLPARQEVNGEGLPSLKLTGEKPAKINKKRDFIAVYKKCFGNTKVKGLLLNRAKLDKALDKPVPVIDEL